MTLNFFLVGKSHASHFEEAYDYYKKRLLKYAKVNITRQAFPITNRQSIRRRIKNNFKFNS